jgi:heavy metal sensor kinase
MKMKPSNAHANLTNEKFAFWRTLRFRFALWIASLLLFVLIVFSTFVYFTLRISLLAGIDDALRLSATQTVSTINIQNGQINFSDSIPDGSAGSDLQERGLTIRILSLDGRPLEAFGPFSNLPVNAASLTAASKGQASLSTIADPGEGDPVRLYSEPILDNGQLVGVVQVAQSLGDMNDTLSRLLTAILLGAPLLVGFAGIGGYLLAARALSPIDRMTLTAQRISAEDLSARIDLPGTDDEVGRLAATFDHMIRRLDEAFRRERQFTADASHELRTPLAAMQAIISVIREERRSPEDYEQALDDLAEETDRLRALSEDLLNLARSDTHKTLAFEEIDISTLLYDLCDSLHPLAEKKGLTLASDISDNIIITGDGDSLIRLFVNLLDNAIKYTSCGGITVTVHSLFDHRVKVSIADTGQGIPEGDLPHIFERFYRVEKARSTRGVGLGLAIVAQIVHAHGGEIEASSVVGEGTVVTVYLPVSYQSSRLPA